MLLGIENFGSLQVEGLRLYVHMTDILTFHRGLCAVGRGEYCSHDRDLFSVQIFIEIVGGLVRVPYALDQSLFLLMLRLLLVL